MDSYHSLKGFTKAITTPKHNKLMFLPSRQQRLITKEHITMHTSLLRFFTVTL